MSDALSLPPRPNLDQYRKLARDLQRAVRAADPAAFHRWAARWPNDVERLERRLREFVRSRDRAEISTAEINLCTRSHDGRQPPDEV